MLYKEFVEWIWNQPKKDYLVRVIDIHEPLQRYGEDTPEVAFHYTKTTQLLLLNKNGIGWEWNDYMWLSRMENPQIIGCIPVENVGFEFFYDGEEKEDEHHGKTDRYFFTFGEESELQPDGE